jgi:hypothetical protein
MSQPLVIMTKAGRLANGNELGGGSIWHLVPYTSEWAICGASPANMFTTWGEPTLTCPRCIRLRDKYQPKIISDDEAKAQRKADYERRMAALPPEPPRPVAPIDPNSFLGRIVAACQDSK